MLKQQTLLSDLPDAVIAALESRSHSKTYSPGDILMHEGDGSDSVHFITKGIVAVFRILEDGKVVPLILLHEGQSVGEMGVITQNVRSATVEAISEVETLVIAKNDFSQVLREHADLADVLLKELSNRLMHESKVIQMQHTEGIADKAMAILQELSPYFPNAAIPISHEKLAQLVGVTRPRLTEALHVLQEAGKIKLHPALIIVMGRPSS